MNSRPGEGHVNARGHELLAAELVDVLRRQGLAGGAGPAGGARP